MFFCKKKKKACVALTKISQINKYSVLNTEMFTLIPTQLSHYFKWKSNMHKDMSRFIKSQMSPYMN